MDDLYGSLHIFDVSDLIGEEYLQKRKAFLAFTGGNAVRATELMDISDELQLILDYREWAFDNENGNPDYELSRVFHEMYRDIIQEHASVWNESEQLNHIWAHREEDGTYRIDDESTLRTRWDTELYLRGIAIMARPTVLRDLWNDPIYMLPESLSTLAHRIMTISTLASFAKGAEKTGLFLD